MTNLDFLLGVVFILFLLLIKDFSLFIYAYVRHLKNYNKFPRCIPHKDKICKGSHKWNNIYLAFTKNIIPGTYHVCTECGYINGTIYKMNESGLDCMREGFKKKKLIENEQKSINVRLETELNHRRDQWINNNLKTLKSAFDEEEYDKVKNNLEFIFKYAIDSQSEIINKINEERKHQTNLDDSYRKLGLIK